MILSQLANARANITILVGFAGLAGLAKSRFFSKSRGFKKFDFLDFFDVYDRPKHSGRLWGMNHQHHLKSDPKFGRFSRFSRGGGARGGAREMPRVMRTAMIVVGYGYKAFGATVA